MIISGPQFSDSEIIRAIARTWVCLPKEKFAYLDIFAKNPGYPEVTARQFGMMMLDMKFAGREIKTYMPIDEVAKIIGEYSPVPVSEIELQITQQNGQIEEQLLIFHAQIQSVLEFAESSIEDKYYLADETAFLYFGNSAIVLTDEQELTLKAIAYSTKALLEQVGDVNEIFSVSLENLKMNLALIVKRKYNMVLTEQAWEWIKKTDDLLLVKILLVKVIIDDVNNFKHLKKHVDMMRAMFENKLITERAAEYMSDKISMEEYANQIECI